MSATLPELSAVLRRWPYCVISGVVILLSAVGVWFLREEISSLTAVHADRTREGEAMLATLVGGSTQRQELEVARTTARRIDENLLVEANLAENLWYFYKLEEQTKARLPELHQLSSPTSDKSPLFRRVPYTLRVTGTYEQVAAFVQAIETGPRLAKITAFSFARADPTGATIALDLSLELLGRK